MCLLVTPTCPPSLNLSWSFSLTRLTFYERFGVLVKDAFSGSEYQVYVKFIFLTSDYQGLRAILKTGGASGYFACLKCWHRGLGKCVRDGRQVDGGEIWGGESSRPG